MALSEKGVYSVVVLLTSAVLAFFVLVPLPAAYYPDVLVHRPGELVPGVLLLFALVAVLRQGEWRKEQFEHWFVMSLVLGVITQLVYMPLSNDLFDVQFDVAHLLKVAAYGCVFIGLMFSVRRSFDTERAHSAELEVLVDERTAALEASRKDLAAHAAELERSNQDLDQFAYVASHDLKAPLRDVENLATWITEDASDSLPPDSLEHLATLNGRVRRMAALLDDLLSYSRAGRVAHRSEELDPLAMIRDAVEVSSPPSGFHVVIPDRSPGTITTPKAPLDVILRNLLGNAFKHHGGETGFVGVEVRSNGSFLEFTVEDDGPGIAPEFRDRVFKMFQTLRPRDEVEGTGMGLALVKKLVTVHGGTVTLESREGGGVVFRFTWPTEWPR